MSLYLGFELSAQLAGGINRVADFVRFLLCPFPATRSCADLPGGAVVVNVQVLETSASPPVGLTVLRALSSVAGVDADGLGCAV
jgi:hypothetical protein